MMMNPLNNKLKSAYKTIFNTPEGKTVFKDLVKFCGANRPSHIPGDPMETAYREGMRRVFLRVNSFVNKDFEEILNDESKRRQ